MQNGMLEVYEEPGLQSVAKATATPAESSRRASGYGCRVPNSAPGSSVATVPEEASASTSVELKNVQWSADAAPSSAASCTPGPRPSWFAWIRGSSPRERPAVSITADDVRAVRDHIHDDRGSPVQSTCVLRAISGLGTWATEEGKLNVSPARDVKARGKANERDRILSDDEIAIFWRVCDAIGYPYGKIGQLLLLTATRLCETAQLPWDELNLDFRVWYLQRTKPGRPLTLHLSRPALAILRELAEQRANVPALAASPFVFTSAKGGRIESFTRMRELFSEGMLKETGKAPDFTAHDLRRTAATTMARLGAAPHTVELILNHAKRETIGGPVARIYNQFEYESERAEALDKLGEFITALASPRVVPLRRA